MRIQELSENDVAKAFSGESVAPKYGGGSAAQKAGGEGGAALKLRGLPYSVTTDDIKKFFSDYGVTDNQVKIGLYPDGYKTGEGAVLFNSEEEAKNAYQRLQGKNIG